MKITSYFIPHFFLNRNSPCINQPMAKKHRFLFVLKHAQKQRRGRRSLRNNMASQLLAQ